MTLDIAGLYCGDYCNKLGNLHVIAFCDYVGSIQVVFNIDQTIVLLVRSVHIF